MAAASVAEAREQMETLAAHLHRHAETTRTRHAALLAAIAAEESAADAADAEAEALRAEVAQFRGWLSNEIEGGRAYRLSKALTEEHDKRTLLEEQVGGLRGKLTAISEHIHGLSQQATDDPPAVTLDKHAADCLQQLERMKRLAMGKQTSPEPARGGGGGGGESAAEEEDRAQAPPRPAAAHAAAEVASGADEEQPARSHSRRRHSKKT